VIEQKPGGASELQHCIEQATGVNSLSALNSQGNSNQQQPFQGIWAWVQGAFRKCRRRPNQKPNLPQHNAQPASATQGSQTPATQQKLLHMMSCVHKGRYGKNLYQDRIETVNNDRNLFVFLKEQFTKNRGRFRSVLSLRTVQGIFFIKVHSEENHGKWMFANISVSYILERKRRNPVPRAVLHKSAMRVPPS